jgi:hypothetical protein
VLAAVTCSMSGSTVADVHTYIICTLLDPATNTALCWVLIRSRLPHCRTANVRTAGWCGVGGGHAFHVRQHRC